MSERKVRPKRFRCDECGACFSNNGQLRGHIRIHTGTHRYTQVPIAGYTQVHIAGYTQVHTGTHSRIHTGTHSRIHTGTHSRIHASTHRYT